MNEIKVSIITPLYKGTDYIPGLMAMIRKNAELLPAAQKGKNVPKAKLEFILVNDSPADGLLKEEELIRNYVPDQAFELTAVNHTENQGIHAARLTAFKSTGRVHLIFRPGRCHFRQCGTDITYSGRADPRRCCGGQWLPLIFYAGAYFRKTDSDLCQKGGTKRSGA